MCCKIEKVIIVLISLILSIGCQHPEQWYKVEGDINTKCAHGDPYSFWVHYGTEKKLIIFFQGGGVCWNGENCSLDSQAYNHCVECGDNNPNEMKGIFELDNNQNPFSSYSFVVIPYCTADFHWGSNLKYYWKDGERYLINHQGFVNATSTLEWIYEHFLDPEIVLITGCSAGSGGAIFHTPYIINNYPNSRITQLGDSGVIFPPSFDFDSKFGALQNFPIWTRIIPPEKSGISSPGFDLSKYYILLANRYPDITFAQISHDTDATQLLFYRKFDEWDPDKFTIITNNLERIREKTAGNFQYFLLRGIKHCTLPSDEFLNNYEIRNWVFELVETE